jgi:hypothetical protein
MEIEATEKESKEIKSKLKLVRSSQYSYVVLLVSHRDFERNDIVRLSCRQLIPLDGYPFNVKIVPIGGYVYDGVNDCYIINCIDYYSLGQIPFSYKLKMEQVGHWSANIPLPEVVVKKHLGMKQKNDLENFKSVYSDQTSFDFHYIQFISAN